MSHMLSRVGECWHVCSRKVCALYVTFYNNLTTIETFVSVDRYLTSLYYVMTLCTTVGFGNVAAHTDAEKVFSVCCMLAGGKYSYSVFVCPLFNGIVGTQYLNPYVTLAFTVFFFDLGILSKRCPCNDYSGLLGINLVHEPPCWRIFQQLVSLEASSIEKWCTELPCHDLQWYMYVLTKW